MPTMAKELRSEVECCISWIEHNQVFFHEAEFTYFCHRVKSKSSLTQYAPFNVVWYAIQTQLATMATEPSLRLMVVRIAGVELGNITIMCFYSFFISELLLKIIHNIKHYDFPE